MKTIPWTAEHIADLTARFHQGESDREIAYAMQRSVGKIEAMRAELGLKRRRARKPKGKVAAHGCAEVPLSPHELHWWIDRAKDADVAFRARAAELGIRYQDVSL